MEDYVWYACYGSNLNTVRFSHYIQGGIYPITGFAHFGCRDKEPPTRVNTLQIPYKLYFSQKSKSWEGKAVAFITAKPKKTHKTKCVLYRLKPQQFIDVLIQENGEDPMSSKINPDLDGLMPGEELMIGGENENKWYGRLLRLDNFEGYPVYTFTSKNSDNQIKVSEPGGKYLQVIGMGLMKSLKMSRNDASGYLMEQSGVRDSSWTREKIIQLLRKELIVKPTGKRKDPKGFFLAQLNKNDLRDFGLKPKKSDVIITNTFNDKYGDTHTFKITAKIHLCPNPELEDGTVCLDQTIRDAIGSSTGKNVTISKKENAQTTWPFGFDKQQSIVRVLKATPTDMEVNICRLEIAAMKNIGVEEGDKIIVESTTKDIRIRALNLEGKMKELRDNTYFKKDEKYSGYRALRRIRKNSEDLAWIYLDNDARQELDVNVGDPVTIYRSNTYAIFKNIQGITVPLLLTFLGIGLNLKNIPDEWLGGMSLAVVNVLFYIFGTLLLIVINLLPIRNKFK